LKRIFLFFAVLAPLFAHSSEPLQVLSSIRPLALIAQDIGGEEAHVDVLFASNVSPHHASVSISQALNIKTAGLILWVGPKFEIHLSQAISKRDQSRVVSFAALIEGSEPADQHFWLSPNYSREFARAIFARYVEQSPAKAEYFVKRLERFEAELESAEASLQEQLKAMRDAKYGVYHPAYTHFEHYFGLSNLGHFALTPETQVSVKRLAGLKSDLQGASCVLAERGESALAKRYSRKLGLRLVEVDVLDISQTAKSYSDYLKNVAKDFGKCLPQE
jgi:zinc transport system substrate-binding protein